MSGVLLRNVVIWLMVTAWACYVYRHRPGKNRARAVLGQSILSLATLLFLTCVLGW